MLEKWYRKGPNASKQMLQHKQDTLTGSGGTWLQSLRRQRQVGLFDFKVYKESSRAARAT